jgi:hypothetical protein
MNSNVKGVFLGGEKYCQVNNPNWGRCKAHFTYLGSTRASATAPFAVSLCTILVILTLSQNKPTIRTTITPYSQHCGVLDTALALDSTQNSRTWALPLPY